MTDLILWNSIAKRRHSPSDDFLENGLAILKTYLQNQGFTVEVIDWANSRQWDKITPRILARINRVLADLLLGSKSSRKPGGKIISRLVGAIFMLSQELTSAVQKRIHEKMIRKLAAYVRDSGCKVVGIKTWYGDAYLSAKYFARSMLKLDPEVLIVAGGPQSSTYREAVLEGGEFDIAVAGEGERALAGLLSLARNSSTKAELLEKIHREASGGRLKNIIYRTNGSIKKTALEATDADRKVVPLYDNFEGKTRIHVVIESLGCPWAKCNFCTHSKAYPRYSPRDPKAVVAEIEEMLSRGIGIFRFAGSSTALNHACKIAALLEEKGIRITFSMFARAEHRAWEEEVYRRLVDSYRQLLRAGFRSVFIGAESAVDAVNEMVMNKGIRRADIVATVKAMREASRIEGLPLDVGVSLIYPAPLVREIKISLDELKRENIKLIEQIEPDSVLVSPPAPFPGTTWFNESKRFGFELGANFLREMLEYDYVLYKPLYLWPEIEIKLLEMSQKEILQQCQSLRNALEDKGFVTEVTDVHFLMLRSAGYAGKEGILNFKRQALLSIISCDYRWINQLQERVNRASVEQASINNKR